MYVYLPTHHKYARSPQKVYLKFIFDNCVKKLLLDFLYTTELFCFT